MDVIEEIRWKCLQLAIDHCRESKSVNSNQTYNYVGADQQPTSKVETHTVVPPHVVVEYARHFELFITSSHQEWLDRLQKT